MGVALLGDDVVELIDNADGAIVPRNLSSVLHMRYKELGQLVGLKESSLRASPKAAATQTKLRPIVQILLKARHLTGSMGEAVAWFECQPVPGFGNLTPGEVVSLGHAEAVIAHLDDLENGVFA